jgi:hypothetical protein
MMKRNGFYCHNRSGLVPGWFMDVLHELIFVNVVDVYLVIQMMKSVTSGVSHHDNFVLMPYAQGLSYEKIAEVLGVSRFTVFRKIEGLSKMPEFEVFAKVRKIKGNHEMVRLFARNCQQMHENVTYVIDKLSALSPVELGVLFAIVMELSESAVLKTVSIGRTRYHEIKRRLIEIFSLEWCCTFCRRHKNTHLQLRDNDGSTIMII